MRGAIVKRIKKKLVRELLEHLKKQFPDDVFPIKRILKPNDLKPVTADLNKQYDIFKQYKKYYKSAKKTWKATPVNKKSQFADYLKM